jgi:integrase
MRGSIVSRGKVKRGLNKGKQAWSLILPMGSDPVTKKAKQKWVSAYGSRKEAEARLADLTGEVYRGEFIESSKLTVGQWLDEWVDKAIKPPRRTVSTYNGWKGIIENHLKRAMGNVLLQQLTPLHLERYYADMAGKRSATTVRIHHSILSTALTAAINAGHIRNNPAKRATNKPRPRHCGEDVANNVWTAEEARDFIAVLKQDSSVQFTAFFALALDAGMRKGELLGLKWQDLSGLTLRVERQLLTGGLEEPTFSLPKSKRTRVVDLGEQTVAILLEHKRQQAEVKMANRTIYQDWGLMFAQNWECLRSKRAALGAPLSVMSVLRKLDDLAAKAKVRRITPHGLRHTCATLLLAAGVPPHVVQKRLGHASITMTLGIYAHVLPSQQADAASRLAAVLHW